MSASQDRNTCLLLQPVGSRSVAADDGAGARHKAVSVAGIRGCYAQFADSELLCSTDCMEQDDVTCIFDLAGTPCA